MTKLKFSDAELAWYARPLLMKDFGFEAQLKLASAKVAVVGAGGLGCPLLQILARSGVGELRVYDSDVVEASNLQRQFLFESKHLGAPKAKAAQQQLSITAPLVQVHGVVQRIELEHEALFEDVDLIIDCTDSMSTRDTMNQIGSTLGKPLVFVSAIEEVGQLTLFEFNRPDQGCLRCVFGHGQGGDVRCSEVGVLASTTSVMASLAAQVALDFMGRAHNPLFNKLLLWDGRRMQQRTLSFHKDPECPSC